MKPPENEKLFSRTYLFTVAALVLLTLALASWYQGSFILFLGSFFKNQPALSENREDLLPQTEENVYETGNSCEDASAKAELLLETYYRGGPWKAASNPLIPNLVIFRQIPPPWDELTLREALLWYRRAGLSEEQVQNIEKKAHLDRLISKARGPNL